MKELVAAMILIVGAAVPVHGQERVVETVDVSVVEVPVTVVTRDGQPVRGLTKDDFELRADGKRVPIQFFEAVDLEVMANAPAGTPIHPAARGHFLLLFDISNSEPGNLARARDAAKEFVNENLREQDLAAVGTFTVEKGVTLLTNLTSDRTLLSNAIETLGHPSYFRLGDPLFLSASSPEVMGGGGEAAQGNRGIAEAEVVAQIEELNRMTGAGNDDQRRTRLRQQFANFGAFARVLDSVKGRKQILWLSEGFDPRLIQGGAPAGGSEGLAQMDVATSGEVWKIDNEERFGNVSSSNDLQTMGELFRRSDVVLHAIDIRGLRSGVDAREGYSNKSSVESLFLVAEPTGGEVFKNANDLEENFRKLLDRQEVVYILGFQPAGQSNAGDFEKLEVKVKDQPRGTRVDHRAGYYVPGAEGKGLQRSLSIAEIMLNDIDRGEIDVEVVAAPFPVAGQTPQVPVVIEIPGSKLLGATSSDQVTGDLFVYAFDRSGRVADHLYQQITLDLTKVRAQLESSGIRYYGTLNLDPGTYAVKTLLSLQGVTQTGFERTNLIVPDFDSTVVLPPFVVSQADDWIMLRGRAREGAPYPFAVGEQGFIPGVRPTLDASGEYQVALFTWNVPPEELGLSATLTTAAGENRSADVELVGRTPVDESGAMKLLFRFSPGELPTGQNYLNFMVKPKGGSMKVATMPFRVD